MNKVGRGNTLSVLEGAGFKLSGYEIGEEKSRIRFLNDNNLEGFLIRPQNSPYDIKEGFLDAAIVGEDWVVENFGYDYSKCGIVKIGDLGYGNTKLVFAVSVNDKSIDIDDFLESKKNGKVLCCSEFPFLTSDYLLSKTRYSSLFEDEPLICLRRFSLNDKSSFKIVYSDGATEASIFRGFDIISDLVQTGSSLKKNNLKSIGTIFESEAGLYARADLQDSKLEYLNDFYQKLITRNVFKEKWMRN